MKNVVSISLGSRKQDFEFTTPFLGRRLHVRRLGTNGNVAQAVKLLKQWDSQADAIGLGLSGEALGADTARAVDSAATALTRAVQRAPVTTGARLGEIFQEWAVRHAQVELGAIFNNARVLFFDGLAQRRLAQALAEYTDNLQFADALLDLGVPKLLGSLDALSLYASGAHYISNWIAPRAASRGVLKDWTRFVLRKAMQAASVIVAPVHQLDAFDLEDLAGKTIVTATVNDARIAAFKDKGVHMVIDASPFMFGHVLAPDMLDAMIIAATGRPAAELLDDDYLGIVTELQIKPRIVYPNGFKRMNRFAFVIHPLSQEYFKNVKPIELLSRVSPPLFMDSVEKILAYAPPFVYSRVTGIQSPTGVQAEGWLISVGGTPKEIMNHSPEFTYRRLLDAARLAKRLGAQIMGLGAFTKVVGDAGLTVARRAPLPITTGNSYSASGALWAAHDALLRMRLLPAPNGSERVKFKAMVVGATGSIGAACARLLVKAAEEVTLVSPETAKLLALEESILRETPDARMVLSARADRHIAEMDMIVTATSGAGRSVPPGRRMASSAPRGGESSRERPVVDSRVLDIMKVKPGCVITDVARPLDLPPEEVAKRPDVLVIESGEILLPGDVQMKNIGLPRNVAYACLAETIVLALEGRFENFTVGRTIEWGKVREIYKLGLKHGMKLAAISGVNGVFSDADIERVRELAVEARAHSAKARPSVRRRQARATKVAQAQAAARGSEAKSALEGSSGERRAGRGLA